MTAYLLLNHLLNFILPALVVATLLAVSVRLWPGLAGKKRGFSEQIWADIAINFIASTAALIVGLVLFGHDAKMLTYIGLVLAAAFGQWYQLRGWKR